MELTEGFYALGFLEVVSLKRSYFYWEWTFFLNHSHSVSGILWFQDLTLADPYFLLPVITATSIFVNMKLGGDGTTKFDDQPEVLQKVFYGLIFVSIPIASQFPMVWIILHIYLFLKKCLRGHLQTMWIGFWVFLTPPQTWINLLV